LKRIRTTSTPGSAATPGQIAARANKWRDQFNPLRGLTVARAVSLCEAYNRGEMADLQWTYFAIEQADPDLFTICDRRIGALLEMDWNISCVPGNKRGKDFDEVLAEEQTAALREAYDGIDNLYTGVGHVASAVFRGFAHVEKQRDASGDITHLEIGDQWNIVRNGLRGAWKYNPEARAVSFASLPDANLIDPANFIIRETNRHVDHVALKKFIRSSLAEKDWTAFLEIYGIPSGVVIMPSNIPGGKESEYETAAGRIAEGGNGALPNGSDYKANDAPRGVDPFSPFLRYFTEKLVMVGTGGLLTILTQSGSGTLAGNAHMEAFKTLARGDARQVNESFQKSVDADVLARKFPNKPVLAYFELAFNQEIAVGDVVDHAQKLSAAGYQMDPEELSEKTRYKITLKTTAGAEGGTRPPGALSEEPELEKPDSKPGEDDPDSKPEFRNRASVANDLAELLHARAEWLAPVADLFDRIESAAKNNELGYQDLLTAVEEAANRLPELFADLDTHALAVALEQSMRKAAESK
jgi:phage gp29-like protein